jgi:luciferase family oxidoreductase group 1
VKLSIIDQSPVSQGSTPADALHNTIELAKLADRLGYERYWIAEHHGMVTLASPAPEILITRVAAATTHIRVGSGGVMLPHYSPMKVAETFRMLHALTPNRIDLGVGRAPGGTGLETFALMRDRKRDEVSEDFPQQMAELLAFLNQGFPNDHPFHRIKLTPSMPGGPEVWLLGSSMWSASAAAQFGLPYAFAHFIDQHPTRSAIEYYRSHFAPSDYLKVPQAIVALGAICADTNEEAQRLAASSRVLIRHIRRGDPRLVPTPEDALKELAAMPDAEPPAVTTEFPRYHVGAPEELRDKLIDMASQLHVEELMIVTIVHDHRARMRSYELLAEAFGLKPRG